MSAPIRWANPAGTVPAIYDPENNPNGASHAVIDTLDSNTSLNMTLLALSNMKIFGPPAFDRSTFSSLQSKLEQDGFQTDQYVGEPDLDLIRTNDSDSGTITARRSREGRSRSSAGLGRSRTTRSWDRRPIRIRPERSPSTRRTTSSCREPGNTVRPQRPGISFAGPCRFRLR